MDRTLLLQIEDRRREEKVPRWREEVLRASAYWADRDRQVRAALVARMSRDWPAPPSPRGLARLGLIVGELDGELLEADADFERRRIQRLLELLRPILGSERLRGEARQDAQTGKLELWAQFDRIENALWRIFEVGAARVGPDEEPEALFAAAQGAVGELRGELDQVRRQTESTCRRLDGLGLEVAGAPVRMPFATVFEWFEFWDAQLLTLAEFSDAAARDEILLARICPGDARYIQKPADQKLAGDALGHFGGFLKREWRANDVLWGRLDAAETISRVLMHGQESSGSSRVERQIRHAQEEIVRDELPDVKGDYRHHMENVHDVGAESLADVPMDKRANLSLQAGDVLRNMFAGLERGSGPRALRSAFGRLGQLLGFVLFFLRWPVRAVWGRDPAWRRGVSLAILFAGLWALVSIALVALGIIDDTQTLWTLIAAALAIFTIWSILQARFR